MKLKQLATVVAIGVAAAGTGFGASPVYAGPPDDRAIYEELKRSAQKRADRMVTRAEFMKAMEKRFDAMDKTGRGGLSPEEVAKILNVAP